MSGVMVEFPLKEAQGLLAALSPDGSSHSMSAAECDACESGRQRLERAVKIETGPGGNAPRCGSVEEQAQALLGRDVRVYSVRGRRAGRLTSIRESKVLVIQRGRLTQPVPLALVTAIEADEKAQEAA